MKEITDAELVALAALAFIEGVQMQGDNEDRKANGYAMAYTVGSGLCSAGKALQEGLYRRGIAV